MSQNQSIQTNSNGAVRLVQPDPEVIGPAKRRQFTLADKLRILDETDRVKNGGRCPQINGMKCPLITVRNVRCWPV